MLHKSDQTMNSDLNITLVTVPFSGHLKILAKLAMEFMTQHPSLKMTFVVTGWDNVKMNKEDASELQKAGIKLIELSQGNINGAQPMAFTFPRVSALTDQVIEACKGSD